MVAVVGGKSLPVSQKTSQFTIYSTGLSALVARTCNLIFIVLDVQKPLGDKAVIEAELEGFGIRLNKKAPAITVKKKVGLCSSNWDYDFILIRRMA